MKISNNLLDRKELIAIALGGMIGGGIFSILGIAVEYVGDGAPLAIFLGGVLAFFSAYSYAKLANLYKDEGATYSFFKKTFPHFKFGIACLGWLIVFGYISTLALYAYTFSAYVESIFNYGAWFVKFVSFLVISIFGLINFYSVKGMGKVEDILVYTKVIILVFISFVFLNHSNHSLVIIGNIQDNYLYNLAKVAALTFVAYEGFQLVIHAYNEAVEPIKNIPRSIYWAIFITIFLYCLLSYAAVSSIPAQVLINDKEHALAAGAQAILGNLGNLLVMIGALLATSSAINGTIFGASRLIAVIAEDGVFPTIYAKRRKEHIPYNGIMAMCIISFLFILTGGLKVILEFGSITFIIVSFIMALSNFKMRNQTNSSIFMTLIAMVFLFFAGAIIIYFEATHDPYQVFYIIVVYFLLMICAKFFSRYKNLNKKDMELK